MSPTDYFRDHLFGAWRLLRGDEGGFENFDVSLQGFWRSFWAVAVGFALMVFILIADYRTQIAFAAQSPDYQFAVPQTIFLATEVVTGLLGWIVFLMLMVPFARAFGVASRYVAYVIAYNWASLLIICLSLPLALLVLSGVVSWDVVLPFQLLLAMIFLAYAWFVALAGLGLSRLDAAAVVALETLVFLILSYPARGIYAAFSA